MCRKIIYALVALLVLSCNTVNREYSGIVVDKKYHQSYIRLQYYGKQLHPISVPERFVLYIQDSTGKVRSISVDEASFNSHEINDHVYIK